jgi:flagellar motility protein MotE (MotC chaperone)
VAGLIFVKVQTKERNLMDNRDLTQVELLVEIVSEKINAQVSAHEKYSQAFIKILEALEAIIENQETGQTVFLQSVVNKLADIEEISNQIDDNVARQKELASTLSEKLKDLETISETQINGLQAKIDGLNDSNEEFNSAMLGKLADVVSKLDDLTAAKKAWKKFGERILIYVGAAATLIGILATLIQFGIVSLKWGN